MRISPHRVAEEDKVDVAEEEVKAEVEDANNLVKMTKRRNPLKNL